MQILAVRGTLPEHTHTQDEITAAFADVIAQGRLDERVLQRFHRNAGVSQRHLALLSSVVASPRCSISA